MCIYIYIYIYITDTSYYDKRAITTMKSDLPDPNWSPR